MSSYCLPGATAEAPYGHTTTGKIRARPTVAQAKLLAKHGATEDYGGAAPAPPRQLSESQLERAHERMSACRERAALIREHKKKLLEKEYGPDWKEKGHKLSELTADEALTGALAMAQEEGDEETAATVSAALTSKAVAAREARRATRNPMAAAHAPGWAAGLVEQVGALKKELDDVKSVAGRTEGVAREAAGLVRQNSLDRQERALAQAAAAAAAAATAAANAERERLAIAAAKQQEETAKRLAEEQAAQARARQLDEEAAALRARTKTGRLF